MSNAFPIKAATLSEAQRKVAALFPDEEYPEKALVIIKTAGNPVLVYDEANGQIVDLNTLLT